MSLITNGNLARPFIDRHSLEGLRIVDVDRLDDFSSTAQDDKSFAADVCLPERMCQKCEGRSSLGY